MDKIKFYQTKYLFLLLSLVLLIVLIPYFGIDDIGNRTLHILFVLVLLTATYAVRHERKEYLISFMLIVLA